MKRLFTIFLFLSLGAKAQFCCVPASVSPPVVGKDSMRVQFFLTNGVGVTGWTWIQGDPSDSTISRIGGNSSTITFSTLNPTFYGQLGGVGIGAGNGNASTSAFGASAAVSAEVVQNANIIDTTKHLAQFSGLIAGHSYKLAIAGLFTTAFNFALESVYNVAGATWATASNYNSNSNTNTGGTQAAPTFTVTAPSNGIILISWGKHDSGQIAGALGAITITEQ